MKPGVILSGHCARCDFGGVRLGHRCPCCGLLHEAGRAAPVLIDGRYELEAELGRGATGVVYRARDTSLGRALAVKVISPSRSADPGAPDRFRREAMAVASIRCPYVVEVYGFGVHQGACFLAMEYVAGKSLERILDDHQQHGAVVPVHRALTILERIAEGIGAIHEAGIVHRDIKPGNIVIEDGTGRPVVVDFGLASLGGEQESSGERLIGGTPLFMAPEQAGLTKGAGAVVVTSKADVYAFGCVAFAMLTGRLPFQARDSIDVLWKHAREEPPAVSSIRPDLAAFDAPIRRALAKDPAARPESCAALVLELRAAHGDHLRSDPPLADLGPMSVRRGALRVLIVDDDPAFVRFARKAVELALYERSLRVEAAGSGAEALAKAQRSAPDLVLLDFDMPELDGVNTLSRMRALPRGGEARVVVLSGRVEPADRWRFSVLGVTDFVKKPIHLPGLIAEIERAAEHIG